MSGKSNTVLGHKDIFWHEWQLNPNSTTYNLCLTFEIKGMLNKLLLSEAVSRLVNSHDVLRSYFTVQDEQVQINLFAPETNYIEWVDLSTNEEKITQKVNEEINSGKNYIFNLQQPPLFKVKLLKVTEEHYFFLFCFHHIIIDGLSEKLIIEYISNYYNQKICLDTSIPLSTYLNFRKEAELVHNNQSHLFWQDTCHLIESSANDLMPIQATSKLERKDGEYIYFNLDPVLSKKIRSLTKDNHSSLFCFLMTVYFLVLHRLSDSEQLVVCYAVNTRSKTLEKTIGCFTNVLPLVTSLQGSMTFSKLLEQVTHIRKKQKLHQNYPFTKITSLLRKQQLSNIDPFVNIALMETHIKTQGLMLNNLDVKPVTETSNEAIYDLCLEYERILDKIEFRLNYRNNTFESNIINNFPRYFKQVVELFISSPQTQINSFALLDEEERQKLLVNWNDTAHTFPQEKSLPLIIANQAIKIPLKSAIVFAERIINYQLLEEKVNQLASYLYQNNKKKNKIIPIILDSGIDRIIAMLAVMKSGAAYTPLDPDSPVKRIRAILNDCQAEQIILSADHEEKFKAIFSGPLKHIKTIFVDRENEIPSSAGPQVLPPITTRDLAYVLYTSGSTGEPKGVKVSHLSLINFLFSMRKLLNVKDGDNFLSITPYTFDISALEIYLPFLVGGYCFIPDEKAVNNGKLLSALIAKNNIRFVQTTPTKWQLLFDTGWQMNSRITALCGGEALPKQLALALSHAKEAWNLYGPTETTIWATAYLLQENTYNLDAIPIGKPLDNVKVYVLDKYLHPAPIGRAGELYISGLCVAEGYLGKPTLTKESFLTKPSTLTGQHQAITETMYKTGDVTRWLADGNLVFLGRNDQQIKHYGYRIELGAIESALLTHANIKQVVVLRQRLSHELNKMQQLIAYYTLKNKKKSFAEKTLRHYLSLYLPAYCIPHKFVLLAEMPLNQSGKIDRKSLSFQEVSLDKNHNETLTKTQSILCKIWQEQLGVAHCNIDDDFYFLGGDSLSAVKIANLIENELIVECSAYIIFQYPNVAALSSYIEDQTQHKSIFQSADRTLPLLCSSAQKRFWFLNQTQKEGQSSYNIILAWRIKGKLDSLALEKSLCLAIQRHEILRTTYSFHNGILSQSITDSYLIHLEPEIISERQLSDILRLEENYEFDFIKKPPYRIRLLKIENQFILLFNFHHITIDNRSLCTLMNEISLSYQDIIADNLNFQLPKLKLQYADFSCWEADKIRSHTFEQSLNYWKKRLNGYQELELFPMKDTLLDSIQSGDSYHLSVENSLLERIKVFCREKKITLFTLFLSIYYILLNRYSRQNDILIGVPIDQRQSSVFENVIGCFINTLVLRADLSSDIDFITFIKQIQDNNLADFKHQDVPFDYLIEQLKVKRIEHQLPLVRTIFSMAYEGEQPTLNLGNLFIEPILIPVTQAKFDLSLQVFEKYSAIDIVIEYHSERYDRANIQRMSQHFLHLLNHFIEKPNDSIKKVSLLTREEKEEILIKWNNTYADYPRGKTVHELFAEQVARNPYAIAIVDQERSINYLELHTRSSNLAYFLIENNIGNNSLVPIFAERSIELIVGQLAVLKTGAAFIPLNPKTPAKRLQLILEETNAHLWLTKKKFYNKLKSDIGLKNINITAKLLCVDEIEFSIGKDITYSHNITSEQLAYAIYTSGSTGQPKLVGIKHKSLVNLIWWHIKEYKVTSNDKASVVSSESFDALIWEIFPYLVTGASLYVIGTENLLNYNKWASCISFHKISIGFLPTPLVNQLLTANRDLPSTKLRFLLTGGDQLIFPHENKYSFKIINHYGLTETCIVATKFEVNTKKINSSFRPPIGKPISNYIAYILDDYLNPVPINVPGELYIGGVGTQTSYLNNPLMVQEKYIKNPFEVNNDNNDILYRTGDIVSWLADGNITFIGRIDNQIKLRGFRIELGEIENTLLAYPHLEEAVVIVKTSNTADKYLVAYLRTEQNIPINNEEITHFLKAKLPEYMIPRKFFILEEFPLTSNGKINRKYLENLPIDHDVIDNEKNNKSIAKSTPYSILLKVLKESLELPTIDPKTNFFDLGVHSLMLMQLIDKIKQEIKVNIYVNDFFEYPTLAQLSEMIEKRLVESLKPSDKSTVAKYPDANTRLSNSTDDIAIIAITCQFPGASDPEEFWQHLCQGNETISFFSEQELQEAGIPENLLQDPHYVKARGLIEDADCFDAAFFNISPREAMLMDPQQRLFLQQAWIALELAGYCPQKYHGSIGVFAGADESHYFDSILRPTLGNQYEVNDLQTMITNTTQAFLSTKTSYKLGLTGPSLNINTACSTGLVAIDTACQYLKNRSCDIALAGAISIKQPQISGYTYQPESILSPDGHCRAFDKDAGGTVPSAGVGIVVLKRLDDALRENDSILAVIKSTFINNDGMQKAGFTAPSISGQAYCISQALQSAKIAPETISYIETHGTGTSLGDPIEIKALSSVFPKRMKAKKCLIGSVKTNIGHADAAAGIAGFIKTTLMLKNKKMPPSLHFQESNQSIAFKDTPFKVNTKLREWEKSADHPRRAGVSAFGIGGTNAHVIVEEAPKQQSSDNQQLRKYQILMLSAKTKSALDIKLSQLEQYLKVIKQKKSTNKTQLLADIAFTLQIGRSDFDERYALVCADLKEAIIKIADKAGYYSSLNKSDSSAAKPKIVFLLPGQGAQYAAMGKTLYEGEPVFQQAINQCCELLKPHLTRDIKTILFPDITHIKSANHLLQQTKFTQPALFCIEYALACLYSSWGIKPDALVGHSLGELTAAHLAGVLSLEDALKLVCVRGKLISRLDPGAMLAVQAPVEDILPWLDEQISVASINTPQSCTVSGSYSSINKLKELLTKKSIVYRPIPLSHAFHSVMIEAIIDEFIEEVGQISMHQPQIPVMSNLTGKWATTEQLADPSYWGQQLRQTVQFSKGIETVYRTLDNPLFLECGPGSILTNWVKRHHSEKREHKTVFSLLSAKGYQGSKNKDEQTIYTALANLWLHGASIDWAAYHNNRTCQRTAMPTYPFEKTRYWPKSQGSRTIALPIINQETNLSRCFYRPSWSRLDPLDSLQVKDSDNSSDAFIVFAREYDDKLSNALIQKLHALQYEVTCVYQGDKFESIGQSEYHINPRNFETYTKLLQSLYKSNKKEYQLIHLWGVNDRISNFDTITETLYQGLYSITFLTQASAIFNAEHQINILVINDHLQSLFLHENICAAKSAVLGACQTIPVEYKNIKIVTLDITKNKDDLSEEQLANCLIIEVLEASRYSEVKQFAYRNGYRWEKTFQPLELSIEGILTKHSVFKDKGVYLITGGLGGISLSLASNLARTTSVHIALIGHSAIPVSQTWEQWLQNNTSEHPDYAVIKKLFLLKAQGVSLSVWSADVASYQQMNTVVNSIEEKIGPIRGIIHAAGIAGSGLIQKKSVDDIHRVLQPKIFGAYVLSYLFKTKPLDFVVLFSSLTALTGGIGQLDYSAANAALDAFPSGSYFHPDTFVTTINWNAWSEVGMHAAAIKTAKNLALDLYEINKNNTITPEQGFRSLILSLTKRLPNLAISRLPIDELIKNTGKQDLAYLLKNNSVLDKSNKIKKQYTSEEEIAFIFKNVLGTEKINPNDDFFALGGDSLSALSLIEKIEKQYNCSLSLNQIYHTRTPIQLAKFIKESSYPKSESPLVLLNTKGELPPIFFIHPVGGTIFCYIPLASQFENQQLLYAIQDPALMKLDGYEFNTLEEMASYYLTEIRKIQAEGPYYIGGYSMGGTIAFEIAHQLQRSGEKINFLALLDSWAVFTDQFRDKHFFAEKMRAQLGSIEKKLKSSISLNIDSMLSSQWSRMQLLLKYKPKILSCKITLFKAEKLLPEYEIINNSSNHWYQYSNLPIECYTTPGDHDTLMLVPNINVLSKNLLACLAKIKKEETYHV
jgi:amino acid adenylation domain-containing protein